MWVEVQKSLFQEGLTGPSHQTMLKNFSSRKKHLAEAFYINKR